MFKLVHDMKVATRFIKYFEALIANGAKVSSGWLSTPGGGFEAQIYYREDLGIWAYIDANLYKNRYSCWFGCGEPTWRPVIEINIPTSRTLHCYGQLAIDENNTSHLIHRGGLGGGKYSVKSEVFSDLINHFVRDEINDGGTIRKYFVIGSVDDPRTLERLALYVKEAAQIRRLRENEEKFRNAVEASGGSCREGYALGGDFTHEAEGGGEYYLKRMVTFTKLHAKVHRALAARVASDGHEVYNSRLHGGIGPDLYTINKNGSMKDLYEIKVGSDSQSVFTAIGQLVVYSSSSKTAVQKFLVVKGMPKSSHFMAAIEKMQIKLITYSIDEKGVVFRGF